MILVVLFGTKARGGYYKMGGGGGGGADSTYMSAIKIYLIFLRSFLHVVFIN